MKLGPVTFGFMVTLVSLMPISGIVAGIIADRVGLDRTDCSIIIWFLSISAGVIAYFIRRHSGESD